MLPRGSSAGRMLANRPPNLTVTRWRRAGAGLGPCSRTEGAWGGSSRGPGPRLLPIILRLLCGLASDAPSAQLGARHLAARPGRRWPATDYGRPPRPPRSPTQRRFCETPAEPGFQHRPVPDAMAGVVIRCRGGWELGRPGPIRPAAVGGENRSALHHARHAVRAISWRQAAAGRAQLDTRGAAVLHSQQPHSSRQLNIALIKRGGGRRPDEARQPLPRRSPGPRGPEVTARRTILVVAGLAVR